MSTACTCNAKRIPGPPPPHLQSRYLEALDVEYLEQELKKGRQNFSKAFADGLQGDEDFARTQLSNWRNAGHPLDLTFPLHAAIAFLLAGTANALIASDFDTGVPDPPKNNGDPGWDLTPAARITRAEYKRDNEMEEQKKKEANESRAKEARAKKRGGRNSAGEAHAVKDLTTDGAEDDEEEVVPSKRQRRGRRGR